MTILPSGFRTQILAASILLVAIQSVSVGQLRNRRFSTRSNCIVLNGLPANSYSTRAVPIETTVVGYAAPTIAHGRFAGNDQSGLYDRISSALATDVSDQLSRMPVQRSMLNQQTDNLTPIQRQQVLAAQNARSSVIQQFRAASSINQLAKNLDAVANRSDELAFRFPGGQTKLETGIGTVYLTGIGAQLRRGSKQTRLPALDLSGQAIPVGGSGLEPEAIATAQLFHNGGPDSLLKSPKLRITIDFLATLSNEIRPSPDSRVIWTGSQEIRAGRLAKSISLLPIESSGQNSTQLKNAVRDHFDEITHIRIRMAYLPGE